MFRIPESRTGQYRPWLTRRHAGWIDASLYEELNRDEVADPACLVERPGSEIVRDKRNLTARVPVGDRAVWVKRFRPEGMLDRLAYAGRPGKAAYAWNAAMALLEQDFCTPAPLAGLRAGGADGIVVFEEVADGIPLRRMLADDARPEDDKRAVAKALGECLRRFHDLGFRHRDLRQGNILATGPGRRRFCFLDLNRLRIQPALDEIQRLREVEKLHLPEGVLEAFFTAYVPGRSSRNMANACAKRVRFAERLGRLPAGRLLYKSWYYSWELRAFSRSRRP